MSSPGSSEEHEVEAAEEKKEEKKNNNVSKDEKNDEEDKTDDKNDAGDSRSDSKDEDSDEVGLLDRPVEVTGARERKKVQRLEISFGQPQKDKSEIPKGSGDPLGDCPMIEQMLQKYAIKELKILHKILFARTGSGNEIKKNIRKFSGFTFEKDSSQYEKKKASMDKLSVADLKRVCEVLNLERSGTKEEIVNRILEFTLQPKISETKAAKKRASKGTKRKRKEKKNSSATSKQKKLASTDEEVSSESSGDDEAASDKGTKRKRKETKNPSTSSKQKKLASTDEEESPSGSSGDDEVTSDKEEKKKQVVKKKTQPKPKKVSKTPVKKASKKKVSSEEDDSDEDDTPLVKIAKSPPTDAEIKALIKKILKAADLEEITMKKVIKQVFDGYPDFDLSDKKDFIKATVKSVIS